MRGPQSRAVVPLLQAVRACRRYRSRVEEVVAVDQVSLDVHAGQLLLIRGRSGSGKTTLLNLLGGLEPLSSGRILYEGRDLNAFSGAQVIRWRRRDAAFVFQAFALVPELTAWENVELPLRISRVAPAEASGRASRILAEVGLAGRAHHRVLELSGGEQQRVAVARALVSDARVLFADEPTGELDRETGARIVRLFRGAARAGAAVCLTSHDQALIEQADRVIELEDGRIVGKEPA